MKQRLADYCARHGVTQTRVVVEALNELLDRASAGADTYALITDRMPAQGIKSIQSANVRALARKAFARRESR